MKYSCQVQDKATVSAKCLFMANVNPLSNELTPCIAYECAANGNLVSYLAGQGRLPEPVARYYALSLVWAVVAMHKAEVSHRDLKLDNLVLDADFNLKIIDFGLACSSSGDTNSGFCVGSETYGSKGYMAPELLAGVDYQPTMVDLFSIGVILFNFFLGRMPISNA